MQIALSPLYISLPPTQVRVGISVSVSASASWNSDDVLRSSAKLCDITAGQLFLLFTRVCACVCVGTRVMRQCASDACDRYGTSLRKVTQPLQAIAFKKNLQQNSTTTI